MSERWEFDSRYPGIAATAVESWRHRWLLKLVASRAFKRMYRRTALGWLWLVINPLLPLTIRVLVFGALLGVGSNGLPYFLFLLGGSVAWELFAATLLQGARALEMHSVLSDLIYYPRAILPLGNIAPALADLGIKLTVLALAVTYYALHDGRLYLRLDIGLLWGVAALALAILFALAISMFTSVWGENTRDMRYALTQLTSVWFLITPVLYPLSQVPPQYQSWVVWNPMAVIVETFNWGVLGVGEFRGQLLARTTVGIIALFLVGLSYFTRTEARIIDAR